MWHKWLTSEEKKVSVQLIMCRRRPVTAEEPVLRLANACEVYGGRSGIGTGFPAYFCLSLSLKFQQCCVTTDISIFNQ